MGSGQRTPSTTTADVGGPIDGQVVITVVATVGRDVIIDVVTGERADTCGDATTNTVRQVGPNHTATVGVGPDARSRLAITKQPSASWKIQAIATRPDVVGPRLRCPCSTGLRRRARSELACRGSKC